MKIRFKIDQADLFRRGIDAPKSIISIEVDPAKLSQEQRSLIADHMQGIDIVYCPGGMGQSIQQGRDSGDLVVAKDPTLESLLDALAHHDSEAEELRNEPELDRQVLEGWQKSPQ